jgi:hypothetical protein
MGLQRSVSKRLMVFAALAGLLAAPRAVIGQTFPDRMPVNLTIFMIHHAERPGQANGLTPEGAARAQAYVKYFQEQVKYDGPCWLCQPSNCTIGFEVTQLSGKRIAHPITWSRKPLPNWVLGGFISDPAPAIVSALLSSTFGSTSS